MDRETLRKRGWSIHSDQPSVGQEEGEDDETMKIPLEEGEEPQESPIEETREHPPARKRRKTGKEAVDSNTHLKEPSVETSAAEAPSVGIEVAKKKLSKWAARLFDPDRPRGLVQPPQTIPLNDEFLTAFGKREKEFDTALGRNLEINQEIHEEESDDENETTTAPASSNKSTKQSVEGRKVKIVNLTFTTSSATLEAACLKFGPLEKVNLLMDKERTNLNVGRAYVTFETTEGAQACMNRLQTLEGRALRVFMPEETKREPRSRPSISRYWEQDISTKCFRCGQVGHMESSCPNEAKPKPCCLCAATDHQMRACPKSRVCFKCGVPGHVNRECPYRQNLPRRVVCGNCFQSGHHRCACRQRPPQTQDAKCVVCHRNGHFQCQDMKWFFGLEGVTCFNCGRSGHNGYECDRPGVDSCARDEQLTLKEIGRAEAMSLADELDRKQGGRGRGKSRNRHSYSGDERGFGQEQRRAQSQPARGRSDNRGYSNQQRDERRRRTR